MEWEVMWTGIGGQGVQLAAQVLARAAVLDGREVMLIGTYGGTMRGGNTDCTVVVANRAIESPPLVAHAAAAIPVHSQYWEPVRSKLRPGAVVVRDPGLFRGELGRDDLRVFDIAATAIAREAEAPLGVSMVLGGAFAAATALVGIDALVAGMREAVPSYRTQHLEANERALRAGFDAAPAGAAPAWLGEDAA